MALVAWYPLINNLINNGIGAVTTSGTPTFSSGGKLGNCMTGNDVSFTVPSLTNSKVWSICFWGYVVSSQITSNWTLLVRVRDNGSHFRFEACPSSYANGIYCYSTHNNASYAICTGGMSAPTGGFYDQWCHVCVTSDGTTISGYYNGQLRSTWAYNGTGAITGIFDLTNNAKCKKNDLRIYDHCLSPKEVEILSRGLVLHYPMTGGGHSGTQLYTRTHDFSGSWGNSGYWTTDTDTYNGFVVKKRTGAWGGLFQNITATKGDKFTISFWAKVESGGTIESVHRSNLGNVTTGLNILGGNFTSGHTWITTSIDGTQWRYYWASLEVTSSDITYVQWRIENAQSTKTMWICGFKMERGAIATPWCPHTSDTYYNAMGYNNNIEYDVSGYLHNGTINGSVDYSSDTVRYSVSTHFTASSSQHIVIPSMTLDMTKFSVAVWFKADTAKVWSRILDMGEKTEGAGYALLLALGSNGTTFTVAGRGPSGATFPDTTIQSINLGQWYHVVVTIDTKTCKTYMNGLLVKTFTLNNAFSTATPMVLNYIGKSNWAADKYYDGNISDLRLYTTALSAEDVQELYNTSASIANNGTLLAYEFTEN